MTRPEWLPDDLWERLAPYTRRDRKANPTDGFMLSCAMHNPDFRIEEWRHKTAAARRSALIKVLGLPTNTIGEDETEKVSR